ncbi:MAG TPA: membrane dipeptidase [Gemmatimonadaceae bacterium]|nr:membrane dipeptidase [Gemmatimonadaceae bacterium]
MTLPESEARAKSAPDERLGRRAFVARTLGAAAALAAGGVARVAAGEERGATLAAQPPRLVIDALGEIHLDYDTALLDEIRASGMRGCVVTVGNPGLHGPSAFDDLRRELEGYERHVAAHPTRLSRAISVADLERAAARGTIALVYYTQNATPIGDDAERLTTLRELGVRIVQLTYNTRNLLGDGCLERTNAGLSHFGRAVVARMNDLRMLVDVSHCGEATTTDAIEASRAPVAVTHAGCKAVFGHPRNKTDGALRALADKGGVIGIYQINPYLGPRERNTLDDYLRHIDHAVNVAGIDHVAIGSDREHRRIPDTDEERRKLVAELSQLRPGARAGAIPGPARVQWPFFIAELNHPRRMETIAEALRRRGRTAAEVDKILGANVLRLLRDSIG